MRFLSMLFSLCLHVGLIVAILYWPASTIKVRLDVPVYKVKLVQLAQKAPASSSKQSKAVVQKTKPKKEAPAKEAPKKEAPAPKKKAPTQKPAKTQPTAKAKPKAKPVSDKKKDKPKKAVSKKKQPEKKKAVTKADKKEEPKKAKKKTPPKPTPEDIFRKALASSKAAVKKDDRKKAQDFEKELAALQKTVAKEDAQKGEQGLEGTPQDGVVGSIEDLYALTVMDAIRPNWRYPKLATRTILVTQVRIMISNSGEILDAKLIASSGRPDFDSSTLRAIADTEHLPTPPNPDLSEITLNFNSQEQ